MNLLLPAQCSPVSLSLSRISAPASRGAGCHPCPSPSTPHVNLAATVAGSPCPSALPCLPTSLPRTLVFPPAHFLIFHCFVLACLSSPSSRLCTCTIPTPPRISTTATQLIASCHTILERSKQLALRKTHRRLSWRFGWRERRPSWRAAPRELALFTSLATATRGHGSWARRRRRSQDHHRRRRWKVAGDSAPSGGSLLGTVAPLRPPFPRMSCQRTA
jgi:hypothetical protein